MARLNNNVLARCAWALSGVAMLFVTGCRPVGPDYRQPQFSAPAAYKETGTGQVLVPPPNPSGGGWQSATPADQALRGRWWEIYQDPQLNKLEERIATENQSLRQALETYLAAREQVVIARSSFYPKLSARAGFAHDKNSANKPLATATTPTSYNDITLVAQASWEPDLWGRVRRTVESARESAQASAADVANVDLSLHAQMAVAYFQLRGLDAETKLLNATIDDLERQLDLTQRRLDGGIGTEADVAQARTRLETVRAQRIEVGVARARYEHAVGTLANLPLSTYTMSFSPLEGPLPAIPVGIPSQLLQRRPDVAASERRAAAANAQIGVAASAFYPSIPLVATGGFESAHGGTWLQGPSALWSLGAQAAELLFDAGQRHAVSDQARHNYESEVAAYRQTILSAFQEVEDQLSTMRILGEESTVQHKAVLSANSSFDLANQRYKGGVTGYLEVLTAETILLENQRTFVDLETRQFVTSVELVRALGGGWTTSQLPK